MHRPRRRPFDPAQTDVLIEFSLANPLHVWDSGLLRRFLSSLCSGPDAVVDLEWNGDRALVGVLIDTTENTHGVVPLELLGLRVDGEFPVSSADPPADIAPVSSYPATHAILTAALELAEGHVGRSGQRGVELSVPGRLPLLREWLLARGYVPAYTELSLRRPAGLELPPRPDLPPPFQFVPLEASWASEAHALMLRAFEGQSGVQFAPLEDYIASVRACEVPDRLLLYDGHPVGFVGVERDPEDPTEGEIRILGRDPKLRARGLGAWLLIEGLHHLRDQGATGARLSVVAENRDALSLYTTLGFIETEASEVLRWWSHPTRDQL